MYLSLLPIETSQKYMQRIFFLRYKPTSTKRLAEKTSADNKQTFGRCNWIEVLAEREVWRASACREAPHEGRKFSPQDQGSLRHWKTGILWRQKWVMGLKIDWKSLRQASEPWDQMPSSGQLSDCSSPVPAETLGQRVLNLRISDMREDRRQVLFWDPLPLPSLMKVASQLCYDSSVIPSLLWRRWLDSSPRKLSSFREKSPQNLILESPPTKWLLPSWSLSSDAYPGTKHFSPSLLNRIRSSKITKHLRKNSNAKDRN